MKCGRDNLGLMPRMKYLSTESSYYCYIEVLRQGQVYVVSKKIFVV